MMDLLKLLLEHGPTGLLGAVLLAQHILSRRDRVAQYEAFQAMFVAQSAKYGALTDKFVTMLELQMNHTQNHNHETDGEKSPDN